MKLFIITFYKLKMMFEDRAFLAAMIIIPLFITILAGYALRYEKLNIIPVAAVDEDNSDYSGTVIDRLSKKEGLLVIPADKTEALRMIKSNKVEAVFVIKDGFKEKLSKGENKGIIDIVKSPSSFSANFIGEIIAGEVMRLSSAHMAADWILKQYKSLNKQADAGLTNEVMRYADSQWEPEPLMTIKYYELEGNSMQDVPNIQIPSAKASSIGIIVAFIMFYILFSSGWLIEERRNGTLKRLAAGPDALLHSYAGSVLALLISGTLYVILFDLAIRLGFGIRPFSGIWAYAVLGAYLMAVISISMFLSSILNTSAQLQAITPVFTFATGFIGGCFWNFAQMDERIQVLSKFTPQAWALQGINQLLQNPVKEGCIMCPLVVLCLISLIFLPLSYIIIKVQVKI